MKKTLLLIVAVFTVTFLYSQAIQRTMVIQEIGTGTWCQYCPGAAMGADDLIANGCQVAVIEYHNGDVFTNNASNARISYYNITGFPTAFFDGVLSFVGGSNTQSMYPNYLPLYNQRHAVPSPVYMDISGSNNGNVYTVVLSIHKLASIAGTDLRAHVVLTESNIAYNWQGQTNLNYVERAMVPDENGTVIDFSGGDMQIVSVTFTKDPTWVTANCQLVAFLQDNSSKEVYNGNKVLLTALPPAINVNFSGTPLTGCAPVTVNFSDLSSGCNAWSWAFPGGTPSSSTAQNPSISYTAAGTNDVTLTAWNTTSWRGNKMVKGGYVTINAVPGASATPTGNSGMCINPGSQVYTTTGAAGATSYTWDLQPPAAGTLVPGGTSCTVNWSAAFTGSALLKVQGSNTCGIGGWSTPLSITISQQPTQCGTPTGTVILCQNAPNTDYTTTGATPATSYVWEITPASAGTLSPNWTTCTVDWATTFNGTAQLRVKAVNGSCDGPWSNYLNITLLAPPSVFTMTGGGNFCAQGGSGVMVGLNGSEPGVNYTLYLNGNATSTVVPGTGSAISFGNQTNPGTYTAVGNNVTVTCTNNMNGTSVVTSDPQVPNAPSDPTGPTTVHSGATPTSAYSTSGAAYAASYSWDLSPASAGTIAGTGTTGTVTWNSSFIGTAQVKVKASNSCGESAFSNAISVAVDNYVGLENHHGQVFSIYPNPAKEMLTIVPVRTMKADIKILNALGTMIINQPGINLSTGYQLDISTLAPGIYFISINSNDGQQIRKVVVE